MTRIPLRLTFAGAAHRPVAGWLLRSSSVAEWLSVAASSPGDQEAIRLLLLPEAVAILSPRFADLPVPPRCQGYGYAAERVLVPIDAEVDPPLTSDEFRELLPDAEAKYVWHPSEGLIRFDAEHVLTMFDLLTGPDERRISWDAARTAPAFVDRLLSVASAEPLRTMLEVEQEWNAEIGPVRSLKDLPAAPDEAPLRWRERFALATAKIRLAIARWWNRLASEPPPGRAASPSGSGIHIPDFVAKLLVLLIAFLMLRALTGQMSVWPGLLGLLIGLGALGLASFLSDGSGAGSGRSSGSSTGSSGRSSGSGFWGGLWQRYQQWRTSRGQSGSWFGQADQELRRREINRLLNLLEQNPDDALRFAIPMGGDAARGLGFAGNQLVQRDLNFSLGSSGGGPVDPWNIDPQQQIQLMQRYRELAERELRSGRARRAAYVYSQLLGDWPSAANALKTGRYFAEAAAIYRDRLRNFSEAAKCYESAGQYVAALALYREQHQFVDAGDLCGRIGREEEAARDYRHAVDRAFAAGHLQTAADVLETRLQAIEEALELLEQTWPGHANADRHFDHWFALTARHSRNDLARRRIESLSGETTSAAALKLLPRLQQLRTTYPHADVQHAAKDQTWQLVARHLPEADAGDAKLLTQYLPSLSPQDRLLPRDCQRFVDRRRDAEAVPVKKLPRQAPLKLEAKFRLISTDHSEPILSCREGWVFLEESAGQMPFTLQLVSWNLEPRQVPLECGPENRACALAAVMEQRREIWLQPVSGSESTVLWPGRSEPWTIRYPAFLPRNWLAVEALDSGMTYVLWIDDGGLVWLTRFAPNGTVSRSHRVAEEWLADPSYVVPLSRGKARLVLLDADEVLVYLPVSDDRILGEGFDSDGVRHWSDAFPARAVAGPLSPGTSPTLILTEQEVSLLEDPRRPQAGHKVLTDWSLPQAAALPGGMFVVADDRRIALFATADGREIHNFKWNATLPRAISAAGIGRFSILRHDGEVELWSW